MCSLVREQILIREHILAENRINDSNGAGSYDNCENDVFSIARVREHILIGEHIILAENREINDGNGAGSYDNCENDALCLFPTLDPAFKKKSESIIRIGILDNNNKDTQ